jgi:hypothetical protein
MVTKRFYSEVAMVVPVTWLNPAAVAAGMRQRRCHFPSIGGLFNVKVNVWELEDEPLELVVVTTPMANPAASVRNRSHETSLVELRS